MSLLSRTSTGLLALLILAGCGGGGGGSATPSPGQTSDPDTGPGQTAVSIAWPSRGRSVPLEAESIAITILRAGKTLRTSLVVRPADGSPSVVSFSNLPLATLEIRLASYASSDGTGIPLSLGTSSIVPVTVAPTPVTVAMEPIVASLALSTTSFGVPLNGSTSLSLQAADAAGTSLTVPATVVWTSDTPTVASVSGSGATITVTGVAAGSTTIRARLVRADGTTVSAEALVTVSTTGGTVTVH